MKIAVHIVRTLLALLFLFASVTMLFKLVPQPAPAPEVIPYMTGVMTVNLITIVKVIELICGLLLLINLFAPLANVILFPISLNILLFHAYLSPKELPMCIVILLFHFFLAYAYRKNYAGLISTKPI